MNTITVLRVAIVLSVMALVVFSIGDAIDFEDAAVEIEAANEECERLGGTVGYSHAFGHPAWHCELPSGEAVHMNELNYTTETPT